MHTHRQAQMPHIHTLITCHTHAHTGLHSAHPKLSSLPLMSPFPGGGDPQRAGTWGCPAENHAHPRNTPDGAAQPQVRERDSRGRQLSRVDKDGLPLERHRAGKHKGWLWGPTVLGTLAWAGCSQDGAGGKGASVGCTHMCMWVCAQWMRAVQVCLCVFKETRGGRRELELPSSCTVQVICHSWNTTKRLQGAGPRAG